MIRKIKLNIFFFVFALLIVIFSILFICWKFFIEEYYHFDSRVINVSKGIKFEEENSYDTVGWLQVQGTSIDLPILYNEKEDYPVELEGYAWIPDYVEKFNNHLEISAHNIFNLSSNPKIKSNDFKRFEELMGFVYEDFAKKNEYFQLTLGDKEYIYKIFMVGFVPVVDTIFFPMDDEYSEEQMENYLKILKDYNIYNYDIDVSKTDKIASLTTCTRFFGANADWKFYVVGRLLRDNERIRSYSVLKSDKYREIEDVMKDGKTNDEI